MNSILVCFRILMQLVYVRGELCARGYWNTQTGVSKSGLLDWFAAQIKKIGLSDVNTTLYFPQISGKKNSLFHNLKQPFSV